VKPDYFDEPVAARYDAELGELAEPAAIDGAVNFLVEHARGGAALELGIGTGRIALPLRERGVKVAGIDLSTAMVAQLRAKPGGTAVDVAIGDFAHTTVPRRFRLVYLVYNTIENLTEQDKQVACFRNAAAHLEPGGRFVIEVEVPGLRRLPAGERFRPFTVTSTHLGIDEFDVVNQGLISHHYRVENDRVTVRSYPFRYVWPAELDLMAQLAGMRLLQRWADWDRSAFTADSGKHVSVWVKA
jgi:SAM-dependent methyltransferase